MNSYCFGCLVLRVLLFHFVILWNCSNCKGELQCENNLISYEKAFKMLENNMYITVIGQVVLELPSFKVGSGNHQTGVSFRNFQKYEAHFTVNDVISDKS